MKLRCEITAAENNGTTLKLRLQGARPKGADWRPMGVQAIEIDDTPTNLKTYHLGRILTITISPESR
jgi:hypothetical protein